MSDIKLPPSMPPPAPSIKVSASQPASQNPVAPAPPPAVVQAVVRETPAPIRQQQKPVHTEGKVTSSDPAAHRMTISTPEGDVVVETDTPLPPETEVTVDIYVQGNVERARIAVARQEDAARAELDNIKKDLPPPPLKEGDTVTALVLPEETPVREDNAPPPTQRTYPPDPPSAPYAEEQPLTPSLSPRAESVKDFSSSASSPALPLSSHDLPLEPVVAALTFLASSPATLTQFLQKMPSMADVPQPLREALILMSTSISPHQALSGLTATQSNEIGAFLRHPSVQKNLEAFLPENLFLPLRNTTMPHEQPVQSVLTQPQQEAPFKQNTPLSPLSALLQAMLPAVTPAPAHTSQEEKTSALFPHAPVFAHQQGFRQLQASDIGAPQNMISMRIVKIIPPAVSSPATAATPPSGSAETTKTDNNKNVAAATSNPALQIPGLKRGIVEMTTPKGFPIIDTDMGHIVLRTPATIAEGSTIIFSPAVMTVDDILRDSQTLSSLPLGIGQQAAPFSPLLSTFWPAMQDALTTLDAAAQATQASGNTASVVAAAANNLRDTLPSPSPRMVPTALFFLAALRIGAVENWLGQNTLQALKESGRKDLADKLGGDFKTTSAQSRETLAGDWRAISMPLLHDDHLSQLHFYVRRQNTDDDQKNGGNGESMTRFLVNFNLSRMGDLQLDGLLRSKKFDLVLRTDAALPAAMRQELAQTFHKGLDQTGMQGGISFQTRSQGWVNVPLPQQSGTFA